MGAKGSVGFASSTIRAKASSTEKAKRRAAIPTTPAIEAKVADFRVNNNGDEAQTRPLPTLPVGDSGLSCDTSIMAEMKLIRARKLTDYTVVSYRETPVGVEAVPVNGCAMFEGKARVLASYTTSRGTWFQVEAQGKRYIIGEWLVAGAVSPSPLPEKVEVVNVEPLLLPDGGEQKRREKQVRRWNRLASQYKVMKSGEAIELPAYFGGDFKAEAAAMRVRLERGERAPFDIGGGVIVRTENGMIFRSREKAG